MISMILFLYLQQKLKTVIIMLLFILLVEIPIFVDKSTHLVNVISHIY